MAPSVAFPSSQPDRKPSSYATQQQQQQSASELSVSLIIAVLCG